MKHSNLFFAFIIAIFLFVTGCASTTPLIKASANGDSLAVQKLINEGANINEPDSKGYTPMMHAVLSGNIETVKTLLNKGADINARDKESGNTAVLWALSYGYFDIAKLLIEKGADINVKSPEGETVLDLALSSTQGNIVDDLIKVGNINIWIPEAGKARLFFVCSDLYDYIKVTVGKQSKRLNQNRNSGVAFIDVDSGKHAIDANIDKYVSPTPTSIDVIAGQTYYFRVTQNMRNRIWGYALVISSSLIDKVTGDNPFTITPLKESEAKQEIKEILKSKELTDEIVIYNKPSAEITKPNVPPQTNSETKTKSSDSSEYAKKLRELKKLKDEGLLTDQEYEQKRKLIVDSM
jgi:hypothetical protein